MNIEDLVKTETVMGRGKQKVNFINESGLCSPPLSMKPPGILGMICESRADEMDNL